MNEELEETEEETLARIKENTQNMYDYVINVKVLIDLIDFKNKQIDNLEKNKASYLEQIFNKNERIKELENDNQVLRETLYGGNIDEEI